MMQASWPVCASPQGPQQCRALLAGWSRQAWVPARLRLRALGAGRGRDAASRRSDATAHPVAYPKTAVVPTELLRSDFGDQQEHLDDPLTVYSLRFSTGYGRGAALSSANSGGGVNVVLIAADGRAVLHRVSPVNDPEEARHEVEHMCQIIDDSVGADCASALKQGGAAGAAPAVTPPPTPPQQSSYSLPPKPPPAPRLRFQEGTVDEVVFLAPELGQLAGVLVGTENGTWVLDELQVASSRSHHIDRFVCRRLLGAVPGSGAVWLAPTRPDMVVYGAGDAAVALSKEQAAALHALNMEAYAELKQRMLSTTVLLTASGSWVAGLAAGLDGALPFALGGMAGVAYQWLLQQSVDGIVSTVASPTRPRPSTAALSGGRGISATATLDDPSVFVDGLDLGVSEPRVSVLRPAPLGWGSTRGSAIRRMLGSPAARVAFLAAAATLALVAVGVVPVEGLNSVPLSLPTLQREQIWQLLVVLMGFMTYKVALVSVSMTTPVGGELVRVQQGSGRQA